MCKKFISEHFRTKRHLLVALIFAAFILPTAMLQAQSPARCDSLLVRGIDAMQRNEHVQSLEMLTQARSMAEKHRWYRQQFLAINNIGANYYMMLEYGEALNYYLEAYTIALKYLEPKFEMTVLNNIAILYSKEEKYEKAIEYFNKALETACENKDSLKIGIYLMNLGNVANEQKNSKLARKYFEESLPLLSAQPQFLVLARIGLAQCELIEGNFIRARKMAVTIYETTNYLAFNDVGTSSLTIIMQSYLEEDDLNQAAIYADKMLKDNPNLETKARIFSMLADANARNKLFETALRYKDSLISVNAQLEAVKNGKLFENSKVKFEIQNYRNEIALNESKIAAERKIFYSILAAIIIIVLFIIWTFRNLSIKHKQKKLIAERSEQILALELDKEKSDNLLLEKQFAEKETSALLEQERLKNELELRNRKLSAKALYLSGRNQMIEEVLTELVQIPQLSEDSSVISHIKTLKNHLQSDNEWDNFITHFEEVNQHFIQTLKFRHPQLTANDIRFLSYVYMNLSAKEIASMLNITAESCRKRKERISSKMDIPAHLSLYDYLASL